MALKPKLMLVLIYIHSCAETATIFFRSEQFSQFFKSSFKAVMLKGSLLSIWPCLCSSSGQTVDQESIWCLLAWGEVRSKLLWNWMLYLSFSCASSPSWKCSRISTNRRFPDLLFQGIIAPNILKGSLILSFCWSGTEIVNVQILCLYVYIYKYKSIHINAIFVYEYINIKPLLVYEKLILHIAKKPTNV